MVTKNNLMDPRDKKCSLCFYVCKETSFTFWKDWLIKCLYLFLLVSRVIFRTHHKVGLCSAKLLEAELAPADT